jgi:hypothetical protein
MTTEDKLKQAYQNFWNWFRLNEKRFHKIVKNKKYIEQGFLDPLSLELEKIKDGFYFLIGMKNESIVDLILTADSDLSNIIFVEELIKAAPKLKGWNFEALKLASNVEEVQIRIEGHIFKSENLYFYPTQNDNYPDEIEITIVCEKFEEKDKNKVTSGIYLFLENYLGELNFATTIDVVHIKSKENREKAESKELIPIEKLESYLIWREKEYVEKYEGIMNDTATDNYTLFKSELKDGSPLFAIINTTLLNWNEKVSHRYITILEIKYPDSKGTITQTKKLPDTKTDILLKTIEDEILKKLPISNGHLYIGRETYNTTRKFYLASTDFRNISKVIFDIQQNYSDKLEIEYEIYIDKYWQSFERFVVY